MLKYQKLPIKILLTTTFILILLIQCKEVEDVGWTFYLEAPPTPEIVSLSSAIKDCQPPYPVTFYQETENLLGNVNYFWDFGDGNTSTLQNPTHIYDSIDAFEVMLVVSNEIGADTMYLDMSVLNQTSIPVVADFSFEHFNNNNFAPAKVLFKNNSSGSKIFEWDFGDGVGQDNDDDPEYVFQNADTYTVKLTSRCTNNDFDETTQQILIAKAPDKIFIDSLNLMLPASLRNRRIYVELYHNSIYVAGTRTISTSSYPFKFYNPEDFFETPVFQFVQYAANEVFKFLVIEEVPEANDLLLFEITLAPSAIQSSFYPTAYYQIEPFPELEDVFIDLYLNY
jgi:hypothetical protein